MRDELSGLRSAPGKPDVGMASGSASREQPSDADIRRFRQALQPNAMQPDDMKPDDVKPDNVSADAAQREALGTSPLPSGPFDLFRTAAAGAGGASRPAAADGELREQLRSRLSDMVTRMMVGDGMQAPRSVRMSLNDSLAPGVDLSVYDEEGFCVAHFSCRVPESFVRLAEPGPDMAVRLAAALGRPSLWRVEGEAFAEHGDWRRYINAAGNLPLAEFRAQP